MPHSDLPDLYARLRDNAAARQHLADRAAIISALRALFDDSGHVHIDTPLLQPAGEGVPFTVTARHLPGPTALRTSTFPLRAMLTAGFDRVYEIAKHFRDEEADASHTLEYTLAEAYQTGTDHHTLRHFTQALISGAAHVLTAAPALPETAWPVVRVFDALSAATGVTLTSAATWRQLAAVAGKHHVLVDPAAPSWRIVQDLYDQLIEPRTSGPVFYTGFPVGASPLAALDPDDPQLAQKWDLVIGGREIACAYTELTDPDQLAARLARDEGSSEAAALTPDWLKVFAHMPPSAGGLCIGVDRLVHALTHTAPELS